MSRILWLGLGTIAWAGMARGVLELRHVPGDYTHSLCGPWGCSPPLQALVAMHGFWALAIIPPSAWAIRTQSTRSLRILGGALVAIALVGLVAVLGWESWVWTHRFSGRWSDYLPQRMGMALASSADFPLLQTLAAGLVITAVARSRGRLENGTRIADDANGLQALNPDGPSDP